MEPWWGGVAPPKVEVGRGAQKAKPISHSVPPLPGVGVPHTLLDGVWGQTIFGGGCHWGAYVCRHTNSLALHMPWKLLKCTAASDIFWKTGSKFVFIFFANFGGKDTGDSTPALGHKRGTAGLRERRGTTQQAGQRKAGEGMPWHRGRGEQPWPGRRGWGGGRCRLCGLAAVHARVFGGV